MTHSKSNLSLIILSSSKKGSSNLRANFFASSVWVCIALVIILSSVYLFKYFSISSSIDSGVKSLIDFCTPKVNFVKSIFTLYTLDSVVNFCSFIIGL